MSAPTPAPLLILLLLAPLVVSPPRPVQPGGGPMFEQKAAGGRLIITSDDPHFDPSVLGLGDPPPPPPLPDHRKPPLLSVIEQEKMEAAAVREALSAPLLGADGEDRSAPAPREQSGAGRRDDTHLNPGAALYQKQQRAGGKRPRGDHRAHSMDEEFFTKHVLPKLGAITRCMLPAIVRDLPLFLPSRAGLPEVSIEKKRDLFHLLDADEDGVLSAAEQHGARAYLRED